MVIDELRHFGLTQSAASAIEEYVLERGRVRDEHLRDLATVRSASRFQRVEASRDPLGLKGEPPREAVSPPPAVAPSPRRSLTRRPRSAATQRLLAGPYLDRRGTSLLPARGVACRSPQAR